MQKPTQILNARSIIFQDAFEKYLVASTVTQSDGNTSLLVARETTLLPNIRGFGPLMALLFCPTMEVRRDKTRSRNVSIITGLGYDTDRNIPLYEEHDSVFQLDVEITQDDFSMVSLYKTVIHIETHGMEAQPCTTISSLYLFDRKIKPFAL